LGGREVYNTRERRCWGVKAADTKEGGGLLHERALMDSLFGEGSVCRGDGVGQDFTISSIKKL